MRRGYGCDGASNFEPERNGAWIIRTAKGWADGGLHREIEGVPSGGIQRPVTETLHNESAWCVQMLRAGIVPECWEELTEELRQQIRSEHEQA